MTRETNIQDHKLMSIVVAIARRFRRKLPAHITLDDLVGPGTLGLAEACGKRAAMSEAEFETFARHRIRGAMLDELRKADPLTRRERRFLRAVDGEIDQPANENAVDAQRAKASALRARRAVCLDSEPVLYDTEASSPEELVALKQRAERVLAFTDRLDPRLKFIVQERLFHGRSLRELAAVLEVTESRVCQLMTRATRELNARMERDPFVQAA